MQLINNMMIKKITFLSATTILFMSSCVVLSNKKYKQLLAQKDSIATGWDACRLQSTGLENEKASLQTDTAKLHNKIADLQATLNTLNNNYAALRSNSSGEINKLSGNVNKLSGDLDKMSDDLKKREERLREVEEILKKRDVATDALKQKLQKALLGFAEKGLTVEVKNGKVYVSLKDKLLFGSGSIVIDEKGKLALEALAKVLNTQPDINIAVEGHTDNQKVLNLGQIKDNWDLSVLRATSVVRFLTEQQKIASVRLTATGKGQFQPIDVANNVEARSKNRRIEIVLSPKLDELYNLIK
jgi:chemotaxis protein MotB